MYANGACFMPTNIMKTSHRSMFGMAISTTSTDVIAKATKINFSSLSLFADCINLRFAPMYAAILKVRANIGKRMTTAEL